MESVVRAVAWLALQLVWLVAWWLVFIPVMFVVATPAVLLFGLFGKRRYLETVSTEYGRLWHSWKKWGGLTAPPW